MAFSCPICNIAGTCEYISLRIFHPPRQGFHGSPLVFRFQPTVNLYLLREGLSSIVLQKSSAPECRCATILIRYPSYDPTRSCKRCMACSVISTPPFLTVRLAIHSPPSSFIAVLSCLFLAGYSHTYVVCIFRLAIDLFRNPRYQMLSNIVRLSGQSH